ncbi:hypothetical protein A3Q56_06287 [Intoshia linei]|uniref:Claudin domain-containing protein 1 n=1 Tax=Intoshia linei TaxID=1819745 RepID=A0A177AWW8_9BILA|nr:hypothetical protein A3Q56_06287 [Intoshia linei]
MKTAGVVFGYILSIFSLILIIIALVTNNWIDTTVNRKPLIEYLKKDDANNYIKDRIYTDELYFSSYRGLFKRCFGKDYIINNVEVDWAGGNCVYEKGFEIILTPERVNWGYHYRMRIHVLRSLVAALILSIFFAVMSLIVAGFGCARYSNNTIKTGAATILVAAVFGVIGIVLFHTNDYLEREKLNHHPFPHFWQRHSGYAVLKLYSLTTFGFSYICAWVSIGLMLLASISYICGSCQERETHYVVTPTPTYCGEKHYQPSVIDTGKHIHSVQHY